MTSFANNPFGVRVFIFLDGNGNQQIADFPDDPPPGDSDLHVRISHFTEIEDFTFFAGDLAHELFETGSTDAAPVSTLVNLDVPDPEIKNIIQNSVGFAVDNEQLRDIVTHVGLRWEHEVASNNTLLIPGNPLVITDTLTQRRIDSLDLLTEALAREINLRSAARGMALRSASATVQK